MSQFGALLTVVNYTHRGVNIDPIVINLTPREHL
jgi:hypothetical protein